LIVGWSTLANDATIPAGIVVDVDDALASLVETSLNKLIVLGKVVGVESTTKSVVDQVLPSDGQAEHIHSVVPGEMLHLANAVWIVVLAVEVPQRGIDLGSVAITIGRTTEVEACDIEASELDSSTRVPTGRGRSWCSCRLRALGRLTSTTASWHALGIPLVLRHTSAARFTSRGTRPSIPTTLTPNRRLRKGSAYEKRHSDETGCHCDKLGPWKFQTGSSTSATLTRDER
jgi:hypothetical protein